MSREAMKLALEKIATVNAMDYEYQAWAREALAEQPAQKRPQNCGTSYCSCIECVMEPAQQERSDTRPCRSCDGTGERFTGIDEAPTSICKPCKGTGQIALAERPAQRTRVWLTDEEICEIAINNPPMVHEFARAIEAKLRSKNT